MKKRWIILVVLIVLGLVFYWYELRPSWIREECQKQAVKSAESLAKQRADMGEWEISKEQVAKGMYLKADYETYYQNCLRGKGLEK